MLFVVRTVDSGQTQNRAAIARYRSLDEDLLVVASVRKKILAQWSIFTEWDRVWRSTVFPAQAIVIAIDIRAADYDQSLVAKMLHQPFRVCLAHAAHVDHDITMQIARKPRAIAVDMCCVAAPRSAVKDGHFMTGKGSHDVRSHEPRAADDHDAHSVME